MPSGSRKDGTKTIWNWKNIFIALGLWMGGFIFLVIPILYLFNPSPGISFIIGLVYGYGSVLIIINKLKTKCLK